MSTDPDTFAPLAWARVRTLDELDALDLADLLEGFRDGYADAPEPQPGGNRTRSYWHGWRNGMIDKGRIPCDEIHVGLARAVAARMRGGERVPPEKADAAIACARKGAR